MQKYGYFNNVPQCLSQSMVPKRLAPKSPKLIHGYTPLIAPEAWLSTMRKKQMSSASTLVFYLLPHPQIHTSVFHHRPVLNRVPRTGTALEGASAL